MHDKQQWVGSLIAIVILLLALALRARRMSQPRPLRIERMWMLPALYGVIVAALYWVHPPHGAVWAMAGAGLLIGAALGWYRGKLMHLSIDAQTQAVMQQGSTAAMIFIFVLVALRFVTRQYAVEVGGDDPEAVLAATDVLLAFGFGFLTVQRVEMSLRAKALIAAAKGQKR
jgi:hypothetical protein